MNIDLSSKAISIKGKNYIQVKDRILALASEENKEPYSINTDYTYYAERKMWVVKATLTLGDRSYTGLAQEIESDSFKDVNHTSALENAETSAVGRACAMAGIGVLDSIASVDEINKANNRTTPEVAAKAVTAYVKPEPFVPSQNGGKDLEEVFGIKPEADKPKEDNCEKCGAFKKMSKEGKLYCSALCWKK